MARAKVDPVAFSRHTCLHVITYLERSAQKFEAKTGKEAPPFLKALVDMAEAVVAELPIQEAKFCENCGRQLSVFSRGKWCHRCRPKAEARARRRQFCSECGVPLRDNQVVLCGSERCRLLRFKRLRPEAYADRQRRRDKRKRELRKELERGLVRERATCRWTPEEEHLVLAREVTDRELADQIGRSVTAIRAHRQKLRGSHSD